MTRPTNNSAAQTDAAPGEAAAWRRWLAVLLLTTIVFGIACYAGTVLVDYESGNLHSAEKAFQRMAAEVGAGEVRVTSDPEVVARADRIVLPGDGAFPSCMRGLSAIPGMLDALETAHPALRGTIRDHDSGRRRAFVRFYACEEDLSHAPTDAALPAAVAEGLEPLLVIGAMAGG